MNGCDHRSALIQTALRLEDEIDEILCSADPADLSFLARSGRLGKDVFHDEIIARAPRITAKKAITATESLVGSLNCRVGCVLRQGNRAGTRLA